MVLPQAALIAATTFGLTKNKSKQTQTPTMPQYVRDDIKHYSEKVRGIGNVDPASRVPGPSGLQSQAFGMAQQMGNRYGGMGALAGKEAQMANPNAYHQQAGAIYGNVGQTGLAGRAEQFKSPYTQNVVDTTLNQHRQATAEQQAQMKRGQAASGFGGSGHAIQRGQFQADALRDRAQLQANLLDQAHMRAYGLAGQDAGLRLQGAAGLGQVGANMGAQQMSDLNAMAALGGQQRAIMQEKANADISQLNQQLSLYNKVPTNYLLGKVSKGSQTQMNGQYKHNWYEK